MIKFFRFDFCTFECDENGKSGVGNIVGELVRKRHKIKLARFRGCDIRFQDIYMELSKMESWEIVQQKAPMVLEYVVINRYNSICINPVSYSVSRTIA